MANGTTLDALTAVNRGLQFRQQEQLRPLQLQQAELALQQQQQLAPLQFQQQQQNLETGALNLQNVQSQIDQRTDQQRNLSLINTALRVDSASDAEIIPILEAQIQNVESRGGQANESRLALDLARKGDFASVRKGATDLINIGVRQGDISAPVGQVKPTASQSDFQTFKQLTARANKTQDPIDIQLAQQFGRQSGFDRETAEELAAIDVLKVSKTEQVKKAATASKEAFDSLKGVRRTIANIDDAIKTLDKGAETGPVISKLPSFRQAAIELDNIKGRMGLDVVGATTFGALSESELAFALNTALPDSLEPEALKSWLVRKKDSQTKLSNELRKAASFLGTPGNTIADFIAQQEKENPDVSNLSDDELFK